MGQKYEHLGAEERGAIFAMKQENRSTRVPARIVWTRFCSSGGLFEGGCLSGFQG